MKVKCYKGLKGCDTETIEVEKSAILKNIRNLFIRKEFIELDNRKKKITYCFIIKHILKLHTCMICITCKIYNLSPVTLLILQPTH